MKMIALAGLLALVSGCTASEPVRVEHPHIARRHRHHTDWRPAVNVFAAAARGFVQGWNSAPRPVTCTTTCNGGFCNTYCP